MRYSNQPMYIIALTSLAMLTTLYNSILLTRKLRLFHINFLQQGVCMKINISIILIIVLFQSLTFGNEDDIVNENDKTIRFGTIDSPGVPIYEKANAFLAEAFRRHGYTFELSTYPGKRALLWVDTDKLDGDAFRIYSLNAEQEYMNIVRVEEPIITIDQSVWSKEDFVVDGWESLRNYRLVYERGTKFIENNLHYFESAVPVNNLQQAFLMIHRGRADIAITSRDTGTPRLIEYGLESSGIKVLDPPLLELHLYPYMNIKHEELAENIAQTLREMKSDGTVKRLTEEVMTVYVNENVISE